MSQTKQKPSKNKKRVDQDQDEDWATIQRTLLSRTLHLHSLSPINVPLLSSSSSSSASTSTPLLSSSLFTSLSSQLLSYLNLRLSDPTDPTSLISNDPTSTSDLQDDLTTRNANNKRRRIEMNKVGKVRMAKLELELDDDDDDDGRQEEEDQKLWCVEIEMGKPAEENGENASKKSKGSDGESTTTTSTSASSEPQISNFCHLIFCPDLSKKHQNRSKDKKKRSKGDRSLNFPLLLTKHSTSTDPITSRFILNFALEWFTTRFDCRISSSSSSSSTTEVTSGMEANLEARFKGFELEKLAEEIVEEGLGLGLNPKESRIEDKIHDKGQKPIEMAWLLPSQVGSASSKQSGIQMTKSNGPSPKLSQLTLTVPWKVCFEMLKGDGENRRGDSSDDPRPLLPLLSHYLSLHTSLPLHLFTLTRVGVLGINLGGGRIKIEKLISSERDGEDEDQVEERERRTETRNRKRVWIVLRGLSGVA